MSEQGKPVQFSDKQIAQIRKAKQSALVAFLKFAVAVAVVIGGGWLSENPTVASLGQFARVGTIIAACCIAVFVLLFGRFRWLSAYFVDSFTELRKVVWPEKDYTVRMTAFVVVFVAILAIFIYGVDTLIAWLFFDVILKRG